MTLFELMGLLSTIAMILPILFLLTTRLAWYKCFPALLIYSLLSLSYNLVSLGYINASARVVDNHHLINNLLDAPLILCFLSYFSQTAAYRRSLLIILTVYILFEGFVVMILGLNKTSSAIIMAPGLSIVMVVSLIFFMHYVKLTLVNQKALGKGLMVSSIVLAYAVYSYIYVVFYLLDTQFVNDTKLIFFLVTFFSSLVLCAGLLVERRRVKHLSELHKTREELRAIYGDDEANTTIPFETVVFKFEKGKSF